MVISRLINILRPNLSHKIIVRTSTTKFDRVRPEPNRVSFAIIRCFLIVIPGLFIGAGISKGIASFLEENELFVPADDDDDDE